MTDLIKDLNQFCSGSPIIDEALAAELQETIKKEGERRSVKKNYYNVTDITNPAQAYWEYTSPIKNPDDVSRRFAQGNLIQNYMTWVLMDMPDFIVDEGTLDGWHVGIPRIRGRIDYRIGDNIIELKTKGTIPKTPEEVLEMYPNDLEQLAFYSVLHPSALNINYLLFMEDVRPYKMIVFKVVTKDPNIIRELILSRIRFLDEALEKKDPLALGKCRYCKKDPNCKYYEAKICSCDNMNPLDLEKIKKAVEITADAEFHKQIEDLRKTKEFRKDLFTPGNVLSPRKYYMQNVLGIDSGWIPDEDSEYYYACLSQLIRKLKLFLNKEETKKLKDSLKDQRLKIGNRWIKFHDSTTPPEGAIMPYLVKVSKNVDDVRFTKKPSDYHLAELGITCAAYGKEKGFIFVVYPKVKNLIRVFQVKYTPAKDHMRKIRESLDNLEAAGKNKDFSALPPCPRYMNDGGKCPMLAECRKKEEWCEKV